MMSIDYRTVERQMNEDYQRRLRDRLQAQSTVRMTTTATNVNYSNYSYAMSAEQIRLIKEYLKTEHLISSYAKSAFPKRDPKDELPKQTPQPLEL